MANFEKFYPKLRSEGGYLSPEIAKKNKENGGETYKGVSRVYNPHWAGWVLVDRWKVKMGGKVPYNYKFPDPSLDLLVKQVMKQNYWDALSLDKVKNQSLADFMADFGVNSGAHTVAKETQRFLKLEDDGVVGNDTITKINNPLNAKSLFSHLQEYRKRIIAKLDDPQKVKDSLVERTDAFFFSRRNSVVIYLPIVVAVTVLGVMYRKEIIKGINKIIQ